MSRPDLAGMTVNERLFALGLLARFDEAAAAGDREAMLEMLRRCEVPTPERTVESLLANPDMYRPWAQRTGRSGVKPRFVDAIIVAELGAILLAFLYFGFTANL